MNLQENIHRIKEMMGILSEQMPDNLRKLGNVDWGTRNSEAIDQVIYDLETKQPIKGFKIPEEYSKFVWKLFPDIRDPFYISLLTDVNKGSLSQKTVDSFRTHFISSLQMVVNDQRVANEVKKLSPRAKSIAKSPLIKPILNHNIDKVIRVMVDEYFIKGLIKAINDFAYESDKRIVDNSKKVISHLSNLISNDSKIRTDISNIITNYLSKI